MKRLSDSCPDIRLSESKLSRVKVGLRNLTLKTVMVMAALAGATAKADLTCTAPDGLKISIAPSGTVSEVKIDNIPLPLLAAPGGFTFRELCPNLVANPGFQASGAVPDQWSFASGAAGTTVTYDNTNGHISLGCVKIHVPGTASVQSGYPKSAFFAAVPGATYTFSAWGRSSGVNGINPPTVRVAEVDRNNAFIINRTLSFPRDSAEWVKQTMTFTASTNAAKFYVYANLYNSYGTFWVDDVWVNTRAEINLIDNPDFDTATGGVPDQWSYMSGAGAVAYDNTDGHSALGCVKIDVPGTNSVQSGYPKSAYIEAMPGVSYTFSAWAKSSGVNGTNQPAVRVFELDGNNAYILNRMLVHCKPIIVV